VAAAAIVAGAVWLADRPAAAQIGSGGEVAAKVFGVPIRVADVARALRGLSQGRPLPAASLPPLQAHVLDQLIDRQVVLAHLAETQFAAAPAEVESALEQLKARAASQNASFADFLKGQSMTEADLRRQLAWELAWKEYVEKHVTDAALEAYFKANQRQFDGSEVEVSHILLRPERSGDPQALPRLLEQAQRIRQQIASGKIDFSEAARKYSHGPSAASGGELGYITRNGIMVEEFSKAAFALEVGEVSEPVQTKFGVHLIRCSQVRPGSKPWTEVRQQLQGPVAQELFNKLAAQLRSTAEIEFTGAAPHFKPGTRDLVMPQR
jgi:parvulin-like peptidyl-prolyl isomerase